MSIGAGDRTLPEGRRGFRLYGWMLLLGSAVLVADQISKVWAISALSEGRHITVIPGIIQFRLLYNPGAAFSIGTNATWIFAVTTAVAVVVILYVARRLGSLPWAIGLGALLGGSASHLLDRLFREPGFARGHVVDFIDYNGFFVGNVADIAITGSAALLMLLGLRGVPLDGVRDSGQVTPPPADADHE